MQVYSDPEGETGPYALPDVGVFNVPDDYNPETEGGDLLPDGWYWWSCFPGCLPGGKPTGPFATEEEATADAQEGN